MSTPPPTMRRLRLPPREGDYLTWEISVPRQDIKRLCVVFEAYDNMAIVRTPVQGTGVLYVYFWEGERANVESVLDALSMEFPVERVRLHEGVHGIEGLWNT